VALRDDFPNLAAEGYSETSPASEDYNCIAWAAGRDDDWWWPDPGFTSYWPEAAPRAETLAAFQATFALLGYDPCDDGRLESGFEKVAFYARDGKPKHAARQLPDGRWTSKLGQGVDISHTLRGLESRLYGEVAWFMKRPLRFTGDGADNQPWSWLLILAVAACLLTALGILLFR
jgi:hypothetical protein